MNCGLARNQGDWREMMVAWANCGGDARQTDRTFSEGGVTNLLTKRIKEDDGLVFALRNWVNDNDI